MGKNPRKQAVKSVVERIKKASDPKIVEASTTLPEIYNVLGLDWPPVTPVASSRATTLFYKCTHWLGRKSRLLRSKASPTHMGSIVFTLLAILFYFELHTISGFTRFWLRPADQLSLRSTECTIEHSSWAMELFRPATSCSFCQGVQEADRVARITPHEFESKYAYSGRPVIITDAMQNWTATRSFSFEFLKSIYGEGSRSLEHGGENCLFFPYRTEFRSLAEVFNMTAERMGKQWYIGWSNCDAEASHVLRQHYQRPYFLPETAESTHADWIFMGTPGPGAHVHIDHVFLPSWQAQVCGAKRWHLQPPPECYFQCQSFSVDVSPGDVIVLDTNKWYHQTDIMSGAMSITIGSEYD